MKKKQDFGFSPEECDILSRLNTPRKIQDFIDELDYNLEEEGETYFSPRKVLQKKKANCIEGAIFAAAALRFHGHKPLIIAISSVRDDDHVIAIFKRHGHWGALAKSKYTGLQFREPIHRTLRELVISFFEGYFNFEGEKTLRGHSNLVDLSRFDKINWMTTEKNLSSVEDHLNKLKYKKLFKHRMIRELRTVTPTIKDAGELWMTKNQVLEKAKSKQ